MYSIILYNFGYFSCTIVFSFVAIAVAVSPHDAASIVLLLATLASACDQHGRGLIIIGVAVAGGDFSLMHLHDAFAEIAQILAWTDIFLAIIVAVLLVGTVNAGCVFAVLCIRIVAVAVAAAGAVAAAAAVASVIIVVLVVVAATAAAENGSGYAVHLCGDDGVYVIVGLALLLAATVRGQTCGHAAQQALLNVDGRKVATELEFSFGFFLQGLQQVVPVLCVCVFVWVCVCVGGQGQRDASVV